MRDLTLSSLSFSFVEGEGGLFPGSVADKGCGGALKRCVGRRAGVRWVREAYENPDPALSASTGFSYLSVTPL